MYHPGNVTNLILKGYQIWQVYYFMCSFIENMMIYLLVWIFVLQEIQGCRKMLTRKTRFSKIIGKIKVKSCLDIKLLCGCHCAPCWSLIDHLVTLWWNCRFSTGNRRRGRVANPTLVELECPDTNHYFSTTHDELIENVYSWQECGGLNFSLCCIE